MPTCREIAETVARGELETAGRLRRLRIRLHFLMCRHCRGYRDQLEELGRAARAAATPAERHELDAIEREILSAVNR